MRPINKNIHGIAGHFWFTYNYPCLSFDRVQRFIGEYIALGASSIRLGIDWRVVEGTEGNYDYTYFDQLVNAFTSNGIEVVGLVTTAPSWATANKQTWEHGDPLDREALPALTNFAKNAASRYSSKIQRWEFWNEPNYIGFMGHGEEFALWFKAFTNGIRQGNSNAKVAMGSIQSSGSGEENATYKFIQNVLTAMEGVSPDAIVLHPYSNSFVNAPQIQQIHNLAPHIPLWITEYRWQNQEDSQMAENITSTLDYFNSSGYIEYASLHMLHDHNVDGENDNSTSCNFSNDTQPAEQYGLVSKEFYEGGKFTRKELSWEAFKNHVGGIGVCSSPPNLTSLNITSSSVTLNWGLVGNASLYKVAYKPDSDTNGWQYITTSKTSISVTAYNNRQNMYGLF
jgi:hypothetical protein